MSNDHVEEFVDSCIEKGISSPEKMKNVAVSQIEEIDQKLIEADKLRHQKSKLLDVVKHLGYEAPKQKKRVKATISEDSAFLELAPSAQEQIIKICNHLEEHGSATPRELLELCNVNVMNAVEIYSAIKWLCNSGITKREGIPLVYGPNWENRPT